MNLRWLF